MKKRLMAIIVIAVILLIMPGCARKPPSAGDYPVQPVPFTSVSLSDNFWSPRIKKNATVTIPIAFSYCESTGRVKNFEIAGGLDTGRFQTIYPFDDSDVYKIIEGASYSLQTYPDPRLDDYLDTLIYKIGLAQEDDGYLYTNRTIAEMHGGEGLNHRAGQNRWELDSVQSHELYNLGHLYEAAVAHHQATGKRSLLDIALKSAELVYKDFETGGCKVYPGHQEIELGLVKLYRETGEKKYLDLARFFLDIRGPDGKQYNQAHKRVIEQDEAVGHSVRAVYMYSAMADIAALQKDEAYLNAVTLLWEDIVFRKMYVTGGIGAAGGNEGFAGPYTLPNMTAYCETCASIGDIFTNHRLFLLHGDAKYIDILEKTLYNSMLSGVSFSGDRFFYPNPLESDGRHNRSPWFGCACCPSNIVRFLPAIPGYVYAKTNEDLYVNLYISNDAEINFGNTRLEITQRADFPWEGKVEILLKPEKETKFSLMLRIPGWARNEAIPGGLYWFDNQHSEPVRILVNGEMQNLEMKNGYVDIERKWKRGDKVQIEFPMPVRRVYSDRRIGANTGKTAIQRGPLIYCVEWPDNNTGNVLNLMVGEEARFNTEFVPALFEGTQVLRTTGSQTRKRIDGKAEKFTEEQVTLIPYAFWNNRGPGQMMVWIPVLPEAARALPAQTIAFRSRVRASKASSSLPAVNDQEEPDSSNDQNVSSYNWWPDKNRWEWVQYDFARPVKITKTKVYWLDDGPDGRFRIPDEWEILYLSGNIWHPVSARNRYVTTKNGWDSLLFNPVYTPSVKIKVKMKKEFSAGIYEWVVE